MLEPLEELVDAHGEHGPEQDEHEPEAKPDTRNGDEARNHDDRAGERECAESDAGDRHGAILDALQFSVEMLRRQPANQTAFSQAAGVLLRTVQDGLGLDCLALSCRANTLGEFFH